MARETRGPRPFQPLGQPGRGRSFQLALNTVNFYADSRYGSDSTIVKDCNALGTDILRHPGKLQLFLDQVLPVTLREGSDRGIVGPVKPEHVEQDWLDTAVAESEPIKYLQSLVQHLQRTGSQQKLFITLFTAGGQVSGWDTELTDYLAAPTYTDSKGRVHRNPRPVKWAESFLGTSITNELVTGESYPFELDGADDTWSRYTFDPFNPFKRIVYARIGRALGKWLAKYQAKLQLDQYIAGFEVCNEVEDSHSVVEASEGKISADGDSWGRLFFEVARAVQHEADWVPMWMPAIASYNDGGGDASTWADKLEFLADMVEAIGEECGAAHLDATEMVAGVDYHHYHRKTGDARALLCLPAELIELRRVLSDGDLSQARLTVIETGVNTVCTDPRPSRPTPRPAYPGGCDAEELWWVHSRSEYTAPDTHTNPPDYRPPLYGWTGDLPTRVADAVEPNDFQGASVWMRLALAAAQVRTTGTSGQSVLVGGADVIGWHTPMGSLDARFAGCGLRMDFTPSGSLASVAFQRPSWFAFQRFARILGDARAVELRWPDLAGANPDTLADQLATELEPENQVCMVEFQHARMPNASVRGTNDRFTAVGAWWAYLLFVDPSLQEAHERVGCATVYLWCPAGRPLAVVDVPTQPAGATWPLASGSAAYPQSTWKTRPLTYVPSRPLETGGSLWSARVALGAWPRLVLSTHQLQRASIHVDLVAE